LSTVTLVLILIFVATYIFLNVKGKHLLTEKLEKALKKEISISRLQLRIPLVLVIEDIRIADLASAQRIYITPSLSGLFSNRLVFSKVTVVRPEINWDIKPSSNTQPENPANLSLNPHNPSVNLFPVIIKDLQLKEGIINFTDHTVSESGLNITLKDVLLEVDNLYLVYPHSAVTNFQLTAKVPWQEDAAEGIFYTSGWLNLYKKDMQARIEIEGINGVYLHPYYSNWVDLENSLISEATLSFFSDIMGENNDVTANCRLELTDIQFRPRPPDKPEHKAEKFTTAVLGIFRSLNQGRVILHFTVKTKMDEPRFNFASINEAVDKTLMEAIKTGKVKTEDVASLPARLFENMAQGTTGATRAIINGAISMGKGIKDAFLDGLKTEESTGGTEASEEALFKN